MTAAFASPTVPRGPFRPPTHTPTAGNEPSATSWAESYAPSLPEQPAIVATPSANDGPITRRRDPSAEFVKFLLTQWMTAFLTYEVLAATIDRRGRVLPTLGL